MAVSKESVLNSLATFKSLQDAANADKFVAKENYSEFKGATSTTDGESGLVVKPTAGDADKFLRGDGTWAKANVTIVQGGDSGIIIDGKPGIQGALWQALTDDGTPCLKLRYNDYEYNFRYDEIKSVGTVTPVLETPEEIIYTLGTTPETVDGSLWYEVRDTGTPILKVHRGTFDYGYLYDTITYKGGNTNLVSYMPFESSFADAFDDISWEQSGTFEVVEHPLGGKAWLCNNGTLDTGLTTSFVPKLATLDFWFYTDFNTFPSKAIDIVYIYITTYEPTYPSFTINTSAITYKKIDIANYIRPGQRNHFAYVRTETTHMGFINGKKLWDTGGGYDVRRLTIGYKNTSFNTYIDHLRFFKGQALWVEDFTPPTAEDYL